MTNVLEAIMNTLRKLVVLAVFGLGLAATTAQADDTGQINIVRIAPYGSYTQIQIPSNITCGGVSTNQPRIVASAGNAERNFQIALASLLSGRRVNINWVCNGQTPEIVTVRIYP